jgi:hypothetical protein
MVMTELKETGCCPIFDPQPWNEKRVVFSHKHFVKDRVKSMFHIPLNFGGVMKKNVALIEKSGAMSEPKDLVVLSDETSLWGSDVYISTTKEVVGADNTMISGTFLNHSTRRSLSEYEEMDSVRGNICRI